VAEDPGFTGELVRLMGVQLQRSRALEAPGPSATSVIVVIPAHEGLPLQAVVAGLVEELGVGGSVARLDGPAATPLDPAAEAELLERYEHEVDHVVLVAEDDGDWRDFCLRHCDRAAVLAGDRPVPDSVVQRTDLRGCDLLFAAGDSGAARIGEWMDVLDARARHLLEPGSRLPGAVRAAARRLAGRSIGIILSGGGARGFAHIGVLEELQFAGIAIDRVGGCSMGGFIGAMFALGMEPDEIDARCYEEWVRRNPLTDYRLPRHSLIRGDRVTAMLARNLDGTIEALPRDFFCVSGDLITAELFVHRRGELYRAVGASMSLPGLVAPALVDDRMLVDGGVLNNLPVDVMAATGEGPVIAVDVTTRFEPSSEPPSSNGRHARRRGNGDGPRLPGFTEALTRSLLLGGVGPAEAARAQADLVIAPPNDGVGMLEWHQLDRMREAGREAARVALEQSAEPLFS
jgi:NTE family protein